MIVDSVYAASGAQTSIFWNAMEFWDFVLLAISIFVLIAGVFSIVFILWWGVLLILSWGKDDKIKPAINTIRYAIIWVIITVLTIFLFPIFWRLLGLDVEKYADPSRIFQKIEEIWNKIFGTWWGWYNYWTDINSIDKLPADFSDL